MKYVDFTSLLDDEPAALSCLSTFEFDPDFFERRLLRCSALAKARRIVVFLDERKWCRRLHQELTARWLNRRYLVVPVSHSPGVFHPKLTLLLRESGGQVICGSNNLTRAGCSSNLELLNALPFNFEDAYEEERDIAREAFAFFEHAAGHTEKEIGRLARTWFSDARAAYPWISEPVTRPARDRKIRLIHTYDGPMWDRLVEQLQVDEPTEFLVVSPFHDADGDVCRRLARKWPRATIELLVQQNYTNLPIKPLTTIRGVQLSELRGVSRRVHAKLIAWRSRKGSGCLVGSANFTSAALDGRNVEVSILVTTAAELVDALFDGQLSRRPIAISEFEPGDAEEPSADGGLPPLRINSALLTLDNELRVSYSCSLAAHPSALRITLRSPGESRPRISINVFNGSESTLVAPMPGEALADAHGTLLATLVVEVDGQTTESAPAWVVQESRLTFEPGDGSSSSKGRIEESGDGLPEYIDELGKRDGIEAVVEYLRHLNIHFHDGGAGGHGRRQFRLRMRDPFQPDNAPAWLIESKDQSGDFEEAIYEFVERHERQRLQKHVSRGNINGMENFLDILTTLIRLLYVYYKRDVVKRLQVVGRGCRLVEIATVGSNREDDSFDGYLTAVHNSLAGDVTLLQQVCEETNYLAEVRAALLILQRLRFASNGDPKHGSGVNRLRDALPKWVGALKSAMATCGLSEPGPSAVRKALVAYRMLSEDEIKGLLGELPR